MTKCNKESIKFQPLKNRIIEAQFSDDAVTSDGGVLLLRESDKNLRLTERLSKIFNDPRDQTLIRHSIQDMLKQRIYSLCLGYEDLNDQNNLRNDPAIQTAIDKLESLASPSTLCRFENNSDKNFILQANKLMIDIFIESFQYPPKEIILDCDPTDVAVHGNQINRHYHGYYGSYCFLPIHIYCGKQLLVSYLRPSNIDGAKHAWGITGLVVKYLKKHWPGVKIIFRADSGFARPKMLDWFEYYGIDYCVGIPQNSCLLRLSSETQTKASELFFQTNEKQKLFSEFKYSAQTWKKERRIIVKAEHTDKGKNQRFIIVHNVEGTAEEIYTNFYCARGDMENRIKELKLQLYSARTSCHKWWPNQCRLLLSSMSYVLMEYQRRTALKSTFLSHAECSTIRKILYNIGAVVVRNTRRIRFYLSAHYPKQNLFFKVSRALITTPSG
jgi:hypothetical protein